MDQSKPKPTIEFNTDGTLKLTPPSTEPNQSNQSNQGNDLTKGDWKEPESREALNKSIQDVIDHKELETGKDKEPVLKPVDPTLPSENSASDSATVEHLVGSRLGQNLPSKSGGLTSEGLNPDFRFDDRKVTAGQYVPERVDVKKYSIHKGQLLSEISLVLKESGADTQQQLKSLEKISIILERFLQE